MCIERRRFSQTMASEWQTALVVSHKIPWCALFTAVKHYNKSLENCKTSSRPRPRPKPNVQDQDQDQDFMIQDKAQWPRLSFLSSRRLETKTWSRELHHCIWTGTKVKVNHKSVYRIYQNDIRYLKTDTDIIPTSVFEIPKKYRIPTIKYRKVGLVWYFSTSIDCELYSFLIVAMQENLWSNGTSDGQNTILK